MNGVTNLPKVIETLEADPLLLEILMVKNMMMLFLLSLIDKN